MSTQTTGITITARVAGAEAAIGKLSKQVQQLEGQLARTSKSSASAATSAGNFKLSMAQMGAGAVVAANQATQLLSTLDQWARQGAALSGVNANFRGNIEALRAATGGLITDMDLMTASNMAMSLGAATSAEEMTALARSADIVASKMGIDTTAALDKMIKALGEGNDGALKAIGINVNLGSAVDKYAASVGKSKDELTDAEVAAAKKAAALEAITKAAGDAAAPVETLGTKVSGLAVTLQNASLEAMRLDKHIGDLGKEVRDYLGLERAKEAASFKTAQFRDAEAKAAAVVSREAAEQVTWLDRGEQVSRAIFSLGQDRLDLEARHGGVLRRQVLMYSEIGKTIKVSNIDRLREYDILVQNLGLMQKQAAASAATAKAVGMEFLKGDVAGLLNRTSAGKELVATVKNYAENWESADKTVRGHRRTLQEIKGEYIDLGAEANELHVADQLQLWVAQDALAVAQRQHEVAEARVMLANAYAGREEAASVAMERQISHTQRLAELRAVEDSAAVATGDMTQRDADEAHAQRMHDLELARYQQSAQAARDSAQAKADAERMVTEARAAALARYMAIEQVVGDAIKGTTGVLATASSARIRDAEQRERVSRAFAAADLGIDAVRYFAKAAAAGAALQPIQAAAFGVAGGVSLGAMAEIASRPLQSASLGGGGGGGGGATQAPAQQPQSRRPESDVPGSPGGVPREGGRNRNSGGDTVVFEGAINLFGKPDDATAEQLMHAIDRVKRKKKVYA